MTDSGKGILKWTARLAGAVIVGFVYLQWKQLTEMYELENGVMGSYRPVTLGLGYYLFWVFTRKLGGVTGKGAEQAHNDSRSVSSTAAVAFALFVCVGIAAGFFAAQFAYIEAIDRSASVMLAKTIGFVGFITAAIAVIESLRRIMKWQ